MTRAGELCHARTVFYFAGVNSDLAERMAQHGHARNNLANFVCDLDLACKHFRPLHFGIAGCKRVGGPRWSCTRTTSWAPPRRRGMAGFSIWRHVFDLMHILYSGGVANDFAGGIIVQLCQNQAFAGNEFPEQLAHAFEVYRTWNRRHQCDTHRCKPFSVRRLGSQRSRLPSLT